MTFKIFLLCMVCISVSLGTFNILAGNTLSFWINVACLIINVSLLVKQMRDD